MPFQPGYSPLEQRMEHLEREFVRLGQSGQNANQQAQGAGGSGAVVIQATGTLTGPIPEDQVIFDATGGHDHSAGNSTAVPMSGDVTGTNQAAVVVRIEGVPLSGAPAAGDDHKFIRYDLGLGQFVYSGAVMLAPDAVDRNLIQPAADANAGLKIKQFSPTQSEVLLGIYLSTNDLCFQVGPSGKCDVVGQVDTPMLSLTTSGGYAPTRNLFEITGNNATGGFTGELYFGPDCSLLFWAPTTGSNDEKACSLYPGMVDNTDATWKGRLRLTAWDFNGEREGLYIEADGAHSLTKVLGSFSAPRVSTSSNTTLNGGHFSIFEDTTGGNKTVTLPTAVGIDGRIYCIKNTGTGANTLTIATTSAQTIDGAAGASTSTPQACLIVQSDGANWQTLSSN